MIEKPLTHWTHLLGTREQELFLQLWESGVTVYIEDPQRVPYRVVKPSEVSKKLGQSSETFLKPLYQDWLFMVKIGSHIHWSIFKDMLDAHLFLLRRDRGRVSKMIMQGYFNTIGQPLPKSLRPPKVPKVRKPLWIYPRSPQIPKGQKAKMPRPARPSPSREELLRILVECKWNKCRVISRLGIRFPDLAKMTYDHGLEREERAWLQECLMQAGGIVVRAAALAGIPLPTFRFKMEKLGISRHTGR